MTRTFTVIVERDPETGWFIGEVVELPGCYTQAEDMNSLMNNIPEAIRVYLASTELEDPLPEYVGSFQIAVPA
ncbi:MAG TPA: type II toxin-antitoxin system HicB family antitoxin [Thermomicrobiaceae bacterium]|nr:type II toxin-antitoxin system HicB family antitoxin [Thermomicrobiaceae bacterium]